MKRFQSLGELPLGGPRRVVAIGTFDGVHLGHQAIIGAAIERARDRGRPAMVITFEPNPVGVLRPELTPTVLTEPGFKAALIERLGVDELLVVPFTRAFSRIRADRFAEMLTSAPIGAEAVVVGANFRFGHGGAGTFETLSDFGRVRGLTVEAPPLVTSADGKPISSTRIRRLVSLGQVADVLPLLRRPHSVEGRIVPGEQRGRRLGLPTANVSLSPHAALPGRGVYAGISVLREGRYAAAINVGYAPTFTAADERPPLRLEAFLLDYPGEDLYGEATRVEFLARLRDERRFGSPAELVTQVEDDVRRTRELVEAAAGP